MANLGQLALFGDGTWNISSVSGLFLFSLFVMIPPEMKEIRGKRTTEKGKYIFSVFSSFRLTNKKVYVLLISCTQAKQRKIIMRCSIVS
jgi:hypothetical protein